ncbi:MAG: hypothetical protein IKA72_02880 [Clostridia bacterium]|nr:hypothetical protein [Clostridia bacterium]
MKKFDIEKQLKKELNNNSPADFASVWAKCEPNDGGRYEPKASVVVAKAFDHKRFCAIALAGLLAISLIIVALWQVFANPAPMKFSKGYFVLDINPSIEVCYDENGTVTSSKGLNDDGKVLLVGMDLIGNTYGEAAEKLFLRCLSLGYFSSAREDNAVLATAVGENGERDDAMTSAVKTALMDSFSQKKVKGVVIDGVTTPELQTIAENFGIDAQKYGLILTYLALGGKLDEAEYKTITIRELYAKIEEKKLEQKTAQKAQSEQILAEFEQKLYETLAEQISGLVETLEVYLSLEDETQEKLDELQGAVVELENAENQWKRKKIVDNILVGLDELKELQTDVLAAGLVESAKMSITVVYKFFDEAFCQLLKIRATPEQLSAVRLRKFSDYGESSEEFNAKTWQEQHEKQFKEGWFDLKETWQKAREQDF